MATVMDVGVKTANYSSMLPLLLTTPKHSPDRKPRGLHWTMDMPDMSRSTVQWQDICKDSKVVF